MGANSTGLLVTVLGSKGASVSTFTLAGTGALGSGIGFTGQSLLAVAGYFSGTLSNLQTAGTNDDLFLDRAAALSAEDRGREGVAGWRSAKEHRC